MLNENVVKLLKSSMWDMATGANGQPNVVPVAFKDVTPDGKLVPVIGLNSNVVKLIKSGAKGLPN